LQDLGTNNDLASRRDNDGVLAGNNDVQQAGQHGRCGTVVSEAARPIQWSYQTIITATTRARVICPRITGDYDGNFRPWP